jgi:hypothetical protein
MSAQGYHGCVLTRPFRIFSGAVQLFLVLVPTATQAGVDTAWVRSYNGTGGGGDAVNSMVLDSEGNVYVTGWSRGAGTGWDCVTLKYDSLGTQLWALDYNSPSLQTGYDQGLSLALDGAGGLFIVGESEGLGTDYDYFVVRYTGAGETLWTRRYNGPGNGRDGACAVATDDSGGAYVTGGSDDWTAPDLLDTFLGGICQFFVLGWAEIAQARVQPPPIIEQLDVFDNRYLGFRSRPKPSPVD